MESEEKKLRHLEMIQGIINRMATNSFAIKGLVATILAAVITLTFDNFECIIYLILLAFTLIFGLLDCYYLFIERKYRRLYDDVRIKKDECTDFSMSTKIFKENFFRTLISWSIWPFYLALIVLPLILFFVQSRGTS